jgi:hypothetical protein
MAKGEPYPKLHDRFNRAKPKWANKAGFWNPRVLAASLMSLGRVVWAPGEFVMCVNEQIRALRLGMILLKRRYIPLGIGVATQIPRPAEFGFSGSGVFQVS